MPLNTTEILDRQYLELRAKLLDLASSLDRIRRAAGDEQADPRYVRLIRALDLLRQHEGDDLTEQLQMFFSLPHDENWRTNYGLTEQ